MNTLASLGLLAVSVQAGASFTVDYTHGHPTEYIAQLKEERANDPNAEHLYVHLISHTHDDVGWLKTIDQYYEGTDQSDQIATVKLILDTSVEELLKNPDRRFSYVEIKFFSMWWDEQ